MAQPSIKDVALCSGVSYKTVSRVVNGEPNVRATTRRRVEAAVAALGYRPDHTARSLRRGRTQTLRLLIHRRATRFLTEPFYDEAVAGIVDAAARARYALVLEVAGDEATDASPLSFAERGVDGTILIDGRTTSPLLPALDRAALPCVVLTNRPVGAHFGWVDADFRGGAERLVRHLIALGHRRIAHLGDLPAIRPTHERFVGFEHALRAAGIDLEPELVVTAGHLRPHGHAAMEVLLARRVPFTAVFAVNDLTALGAVECLRQHGLRVPDDVSVVGFDDSYLAPTASPPLTTARLPAYEMGIAAVELAIGAVEGTAPFPADREFPVELCLRASAGPPPADGRGAPVDENAGARVRREEGEG